MSNDLTIFSFETNEIRAITDEHGEPWFVAVDVCSALGLSNPSEAVSRLEDDERQVIDFGRVDSAEGVTNQRLNAGQEINIVSEPGVYRLVFTSRKPEAKTFKRWLVHEVLPQIRKTGGYTLKPMTPAERLRHDAERLRLTADLLERQEKLEEEQKRLEAQQEVQEQRLNQIETASDHFTILGWHRYAKQAGSLPLAEAAKMGREATLFCKRNEVPMGEVPDPRFGTVRTYPKWVLDELFTLPAPETLQ
jgi:prophage antirepressor-like protein